MKKIKLEAARDNELRATDQRHRLVFGGSNMDTVIHLTDDEFDALIEVVSAYDPRTREKVEAQ
jgi:hypothetical protein